MALMAEKLHLRIVLLPLLVERFWKPGWQPICLGFNRFFPHLPIRARLRLHLLSFLFPAERLTLDTSGQGSSAFEGN
jgi:hypothetical protein